MLLRLSVDITTGNLVAWQGGATALPDFRQGVIDVEIRFVKPAPNSYLPSANFLPVSDLADTYAGVRMGLWKKCTGTLEDSGDNVLALTPHGDFSYYTSGDQDGNRYPDANAYPYFRGTFNTFTQEVADWIGRNLSRGAFFALGLVRADLSLEPILDQSGATNCTIYAATDDGSATEPVSVTAVPGQKTFTLPVSFQTADGAQQWTLAQDPDHPTGLKFTLVT